MRGIALTILLLMPVLLIAQRPIFSQYYSNGLYLNPALATYENDRIMQVHYRSQWNAIGTPFNTIQASYIHPFYNEELGMNEAGAGVSFFRDVSGGHNEFISNGFNGAYARNVALSQVQALSFGAQLGYYQNRVRADQFQWSSQYNDVIGYDPSMPGELNGSELSNNYVVINAGLMWRTKTAVGRNDRELDLYSGISVENLNRPDVSLVDDSSTRLYRLYKFHGGATAFITPQLTISPNYLIQAQNNVVQTNIGAYMSYSVLVKRTIPYEVGVILGGWYRFGDSFIISTGITSQQFNLAFSYDINNSRFGQFSSSRTEAYEISLAIKFPKKMRDVRFSSPII